LGGASGIGEDIRRVVERVSVIAGRVASGESAHPALTLAWG